MNENIRTMPIQKRKGIVGRHVIASGKPAECQKDALVTGNGHQQLLVYGNPYDETIILRQEDLYIPQWKDTPTAPNCSKVLDDVRKLLLNGKYEDASYRSIYCALSNGMTDKLQPPLPHPAFIMKIKQPDHGLIQDYIRIVNLRNAEITVQWTDDAGTWKRKSIVPRTVENIALTSISGPYGAPIQMRISIVDLFHKIDGISPKVAEIAHGEVDWDGCVVDKTACLDQPAESPKIRVVLQRDAILVIGTYKEKYEKGGYVAAILVNGGDADIRADGNELLVNGNGTVTLLMKAAHSSGQPQEDAENILKGLRGIKKEFGTFAAENEKTHGAMFDRLEVDLSGNAEDYLLSTEELMEKQRLSQGINAILIEKMVDIGRYFLLYESGKWPPIYGHVNININHQISCANIGALPEMLDVFMRWIEWQLPDARENARLVFGARGFLIACHPDTESGKLYHFNHLYPHHYWISGSGWCLQPFLDYYYCTGDDEFLKKRLMPLYEELALFYEDYLKLTDSNGKWIFAPSYSPENWPSNTKVQTAINATMDITVCRQVMDTLLILGPRVGTGTVKQRAVWQNIRDRLPDYLIGKHSELKEWAWPTLEDRYDHRHLSHLYGAFPGDEFQPENDAKIYKAAFIANRMRAQENSSAHGIMHRAQIAARLKDSYFVFQNLKQILETGFVTDSFSTTHNPYLPNIFPDAQGAIPTIVLESLIYSKPGLIELLPALPWCWPKGNIVGMAARTAVKIEKMSWDLEAGSISLAVLPLKTQKVQLVYRAGFESVTASGAEFLPSTDANRRKLSLQCGQRAVIFFSGVRGNNDFARQE
jgi:alpha-L-fucosidase 2